MTHACLAGIAGVLLSISLAAPSLAATRDRFYWMSEINKASAVVVVERGIVPKPLGAKIYDAINRVDAAGEPRHHHQAGRAEIARQLLRDLDAGRRGVARAHHGDHGVVQHGRLAADREQRRGVVDGRQLRRIFVLAEGHQRNAHLGRRRELCLSFLARANPHRPRRAAAPGEIGQRLERRTGAAAVIKERAEGARSDVLGTDEAQPVEALVVGETDGGFRVQGVVSTAHRIEKPYCMNHAICGDKENDVASMIKVSAAEFQRNIGRYQDMALVQPVAVTRNSRERTVMISVEEYHRLKRRDREVIELEDFTDADVAALEETRAPDSSKAFDHELKP